MQIKINNLPVDAAAGETILEAARRAGHEIPSLCYAKGAKHKSSCMVCAVKNEGNGQIIPSCTTLPVEGMCIATDSEEVLRVRTLSLELLLSDHRADCEAPCTMVCPTGLDVERMLGYYDAGKYGQARALIAGAFALPEVGCDGCKAPCERACRRGTVDEAVSIRAIVREVAAMTDVVHVHPLSCAATGKPVTDKITETFPASGKESDAAEQGLPVAPQAGSTRAGAPVKGAFQSLLGRFTENEKQRLREGVTSSSRCLHCACTGRTDCLLRRHASAAKIKRPRYNAASTLPAMLKVHVGGGLWFEQAKCIRCGLCVYNSENGFTFKDRGFGMQVVLPEESRPNVDKRLATLCPTGALYML